MSRLISFLTVLLLFSCSFVIAQEIKVVEPQIIGVVYYFDSANNKLVDLERQTAKVKGKVKAFGFGGAKSIAELKGTKSSVRLIANQPLEFVLQLANGVDPNKVELYIFEIKKDKREAILGKATMLSAEAGNGRIQINVMKHGQSSYKIVAAKNLAPGEYAFSATESYDVFCFGVDPPQ